MIDLELEKMDQISALSTSLFELKKRQRQLSEEKEVLMKEKWERLKKLRILQFKNRNSDMDEREREQCRKTNQLLDEFVSTCDGTPFHNALIQILSNMKGTIH